MGALLGTGESIVVKVTVDVMLDDEKVRRLEFRARFRALDVSVAQADAERIADPLESFEMADAVRRDLVEWYDMPGDGGDVPYNDENRDAALRNANYITAFYQAWGRAQFRRAGENVKN